VHVQQTFVELGAHVLGDADTYRKTEAAADWMASRLTAHLAAHPEQLAARPWLAHTLAHAQKRAGAVIADKEDLLANPLGAMAYNTYSDLTAMIDKPMRCISLAPEHDVFYSRVDNQAFAMPQVRSVCG
jgi:microcystin degradation protein MlrC